MASFAGLRNALLPSKSSLTNVTARFDDYGNQYVNEALSPFQTQAYEGSLFVCRAAPAAGGTGVASGITTAFVDTTPCLTLENNEAAAAGKAYIPLYIRGRVTAAGSTTTSSEISVQVDNTIRYTSGGTALTTSINNVNAGSGAQASLATVHVGAITAPAAGTRRRFVGSSLAKVATAPVWVVNDILLITFGGQTSFSHSGNLIASDTATPTATVHIPLPACAVPAAGSLALFMANVANATTPPSFEWETCWIER